MTNLLGLNGSYPNGKPVPADHYIYDGKSLMEIYVQDEYTPQDEILIKEYAWYYANAPHFDISPLKDLDPDRMSPWELLWELLEINIDPF